MSEEKANPEDIKALNQKMEEMKTLSIISDRLRLRSVMGEQYDGDRDLYDVLGWNETPDFSTYSDHYRRSSIAKSVINSPVEATFSGEIKLTIEGKSVTDSVDHPFVKKWNELYDRLNLKNYFVRVDKLAGIGRFAVLRLGFSGEDNSNPSTEVTKAKDLIYVAPYSEANSTVKELEDNPSNPRFGKPKTYGINVNNAIKETNATTDGEPVNWSRLIHVADGLLEDDVYGTPRLEAILNNLDNLDKIIGGSAEMFWRGAFPGYGFKIDPEADMLPADVTTMGEEIDDMLLGLKRYIKLQGVDIQTLMPQVADPKGHVAVQVDMISGATNIPKRILIGAESGELASSMDQDNWFKRIDARRTQYAEPLIVRAFIDRLIELGILPKVKYTVIWEDLKATSEQVIAEVAVKKMLALKSYVSALGAETVLPVEVFLEDIMGFETDKVKNIMSSLKDGGFQSQLKKIALSDDENEMVEDEREIQKDIAI